MRKLTAIIVVATMISGTYSGNVWGISNSNFTMQNQVAPASLSGIAPTTTANNDGKITGTTTEMEYRLSTSTIYKNCSEKETIGLTSGLYYIRYKAKEGYYVGSTTAVVIKDYTSLALSQNTDLEIVDSKINAVREINQPNKKITILENSTKEEIISGLKSTDNSKQTYNFYTYYNSSTATGILHTENTNFKNAILVVTAENKNVKQIYNIEEIAKSKVVNLALTNNKKVIAINNNKLTIDITKNTLKSDVLAGIRAIDRSKQTYNFYTTSNEPYTGGSMDGIKLVVISENKNAQKIYTLNVPIRKTAIISTQTGELTNGTDGTASFIITTQNILDNQPVTIKEIDNKGNLKTTTGLSFVATDTNDNISTLTVSMISGVPAGDYYFLASVDNITSTIACIKVTPIIIQKTIAISPQNGILTSGFSSSAVFGLTTKNIADNQDVIVIETDSKGNPKTTTGLTLTSTKTKSNSAEVTALITDLVPSDKYYFKVKIDGITSAVSIITVNKQ